MSGQQVYQNAYISFYCKLMTLHHDNKNRFPPRCKNVKNVKFREGLPVSLSNSAVNIQTMKTKVQSNLNQMFDVICTPKIKITEIPNLFCRDMKIDIKGIFK